MLKAVLVLGLGWCSSLPVQGSAAWTEPFGFKPVYVMSLNRAAGPGPGFMGPAWGGCGRNASANRPKSGPKLLEPKAWADWDRIWVRAAETSPKPDPEAKPGDRKSY